MLSFHVETYGCQMNVADSDLLCELLEQEGYCRTGNVAEADLVIVNTCSVREHAERRALARIAELANAKRKRGNSQRLWVIGCMAERLGESLRHRVPGIDRIIGAREMQTLAGRIREYLQADGAGAPGHSAQRAAETTPSATVVSAFVPVMRGCDNHCAYCIVPHVRGPEQSLPSAEVLRQVRWHAARGVKEITLLGQNVNSYRDPADGSDFAALLRRVHEVAGLVRIRFTTSHPKDCSDELLRTVAELPKLCKHIHLPVQAGSSRVLAAMNRGYTRDDYLRRVESIRRLIPHADITTDAMVGFPGESEGDFRQTLSLFWEVRFTTAFMFAFSPRPGTAAARLEGKVASAIAQERLSELIAVQTSITRQVYADMIGRSVEVLFTHRQTGRGEQWIGQDMGCKRVATACGDNLAGVILRMHVRASTGMTLIADRGVA